MRYEASGRIAGRRPTAVVLLPLVAAAIVAVAWFGSRSPATERPVSPPVAVDCTDMPPADCRRAVEAAREALGDGGPPPRAATVSTSMICGDDLDCPRWFLRDSRSIGSVRLSFDDPPLEAWVNLVEPDTRRGANGRSFVGLVIRWVDRS